MIKFAAVIFVSLFVITANAEAVGLSVSPSELRASGTFYKPASAKFTVKNSSDGVALFEVYPDDFGDAIKISPESFILEAGEKREIEASANFKKLGKYWTDISIVAKPVANSAFKTAGGLKIPFYIDVKEEKSSQLGLLISSVSKETLIVLSIIFAFAILIFCLKYGFRKFKKAKS
ncbi:hypothetical protein A3I27_02820 [Candidatus Giovannonibacteria bacterium RIFCSPLOWO2_02_FULL_43_11b]|uniref:MSP domain-containing protein n=1 Tax=Candidatus Giovannonibacteria bacterium RIFCSPHIGHO2_12_FULL_43_15 TaxID=1798341 RepID=A0A1F5WR42_9BACT|nr:MAG: hypothetical protein A2739_00055 [Candidatus Giovannonibacteria bacterium RIFCSPHIGHO2_01_FULL_43_100]OGF66106.1 MAG: hypothetical protein A3B97_01215 [Candidatus Giovannonibacteria bacterium RIFCSPHIGHO2_02_FULL_43_32]OGF78074.1 MAG: hypothetical protein A3F23_02630 [Candidatus Giovannonibacteria bacterium RIFCSPHIGHO2_12_FULL_43_15]OGF78817.1 MAG: hypothetical protein A3A15_00320 [Candidatus Giovannonibacteria bacterium RIFCSPLOWO2_01_FULL_43_60]OGF89142.1 MAG: hypothetical protein A3